MSQNQTDTQSIDARQATGLDMTDTTRPLQSPLRPLIWLLVVLGAVLLFGALTNH
jgi:hypothetical protein